MIRRNSNWYLPQVTFAEPLMHYFNNLASWGKQHSSRIRSFLISLIMPAICSFMRILGCLCFRKTDRVQRAYVADKTIPDEDLNFVLDQRFTVCIPNQLLKLLNSEILNTMVMTMIQNCTWILKPCDKRSDVLSSVEACINT